MKRIIDTLFRHGYKIYACRFEEDAADITTDNFQPIRTAVKQKFNLAVDKVLYATTNTEKEASVVKISSEEHVFLFSFSTIATNQKPIILIQDRLVSIMFDSFTNSLEASKSDIFNKHELVAQKRLLKGKSNVFYGAESMGTVIFENYYSKKRTQKKYDFCIADNERIKNLYEDIQTDVVLYCHQEGIVLWHAGVNDANQITNHILSSQVACFNHLFAIRDDKSMVLAIANSATGHTFDDVLAIPYDNGKHYISFEVVSKKDYLHEDPYNIGLSRGAMCTSIDALIIAKEKNDVYLLPIEWKYTESYTDEDKSLEYGKGETRLKRYEELRDKYFNTEVQRSLFYIEPFYQLMRQTIWAEEVIHNEDIPCVKDYIHIHVVPRQNSDLLNKKYPYSEHADMMKTWKSCLKTPEKYCCIDPSTLVDAIEKTDIDNRYHNLVNYLRTRYNYKK